MGYYMYKNNSDFEIKKENINQSLEAVKRLASSDRIYKWVNNRDVLNAKTLKEAMLEWSWEIWGDNGKDIIGISFIGEKSGNDEILFQTLAPYVTEGSFIEMIGEDSELWRWVFQEGKCKEIYPTIIWED